MYDIRPAVDDPYIHLRMGECEIELRGQSQLLERQVTKFYHNALEYNSRHTPRHMKKEEEKK